MSGAVGILGGAFDPPHNGHVALAREAVEHFGLERLLVRVVADPGHKEVDTRARGAAAARGARVRARSTWPRSRSTRSPARSTRSRRSRLDDPVFLLGADELAAFPTWVRPERVLELARIGAATRPGTDLRRSRSASIASLSRPDRVELFPITPLPVSSSEVRERVAEGLPIDDLVPPAVAAEIERLGLYRAA